MRTMIPVAMVVDDLFECCTIEIVLSGHRNIIVNIDVLVPILTFLLNTYYNCFLN